MKRGGSYMAAGLREGMSFDPEYTRCALQGLQFGTCEGRVTREHALIFAGKKIQERWAIIPCCAAHHGVDFYQDAPTEAPKEVRVWVALNRATDEELFSVSRVVNYLRERDRLNAKFGIYIAPTIPDVLVAPIQAPRNVRAKPKMDEMEREARAYSRVNGCSVEEAREVITTLV